MWEAFTPTTNQRNGRNYKFMCSSSKCCKTNAETSNLLLHFRVFALHHPPRNYLSEKKSCSRSRIACDAQWSAQPAEMKKVLGLIPVRSQHVFSVPARVPSCSPRPEMKTPRCPQVCQPPLSDLLEKKVRNIIILLPTSRQKTACYSLKRHRQKAGRTGCHQCTESRLIPAISDAIKQTDLLNFDSHYLHYESIISWSEYNDSSVFLLPSVFTGPLTAALCDILGRDGRI